MAAWIPKSTILATKCHSVYPAAYAIQICEYSSSSPRIIKKPSTASLRRGTGGRSSFNGIVCTIFGASGFVGRYVCNRLGKIGTQLIIPYRGDPYESGPLKLCGDLGQVLYHPFDLRDEESIVKCIKYSNVVINLISRDHETMNFTFADVNVEGARTLARLSKECNVERFIHVSSLNVEPHPTPVVKTGGSAWLKTKWRGECAVKEEFPEATIIRPSEIYGQEDRYLNVYMSAVRRHFRCIPLWEKGEKTEKQPVSVSDVAAGIAAIVRDPRTAGKTYQFVGPKRYKLAELIRWYYNITCQDIDEAGHYIIDSKYFPLFYVKLHLCELLTLSQPFANVTWERFEREHITDKVLKNLPTLEDLGINPIEMESKIPWELKPFKEQSFYMESIREFMPPSPPKTVPIV